jgi:hypothetical protein
VTHLRTFVLPILAALLVPSLAHAALDEVITERAADVSVAEIANQKVRVRVRGSLKEFAGADGKVFGALWDGAPPDLRTLLGTHWDAYERALSARRPSGHNFVSIQTPELSVTISSFGRTLRGKVVLPQSLPKGVTADALR